MFNAKKYIISTAILFMFADNVWSKEIFTCSIVAKNAGSSYRADASLMAIRKPLDEMQNIIVNRGWSVVKRQQGWLILRSSVIDFFQTCESKDLIIRKDNKTPLKFLPVLIKTNKKKYAIITNQIQIEVSKKELLQILEKKYPIKESFKMPSYGSNSYSSFFKVENNVDLDGLISKLNNEIGMIGVYPVLHESRYRLR